MKGRAQAKLKIYDGAILNFNKCEDIYNNDYRRNDNSNEGVMVRYLFGFADLYEKQGNIKLALEYQKKLM